MKLFTPAIAIALSLLVIQSQAATPAPKDQKAPAKEEVKAVQAPTVTVTVGQLIEIANGNVLAKLADQDLPVLTAYRLSRLIAVVAPELTRALKAKTDLFTDANSVPVPNIPGTRSIKPEFMSAFEKSYTPLMAEKVVIAVSPLTLETDLAGVRMSAHDITSLGQLLKSVDTPAAEKAVTE